MITQKRAHQNEGSLSREEVGSVYAEYPVSLEDHIIDENFEIDQSYLDDEIKIIRQTLKENYKKFMGNHKPIDLKGKVVIIVDDGAATGNTILSSIKMLRQRKPKKIVVAVPVAPREVVEKIRREVDEIICLYSPEPFIGVGLHYRDFTQVEDDEVIKLLKDVNHFKNVA